MGREISLFVEEWELPNNGCQRDEPQLFWTRKKGSKWGERPPSGSIASRPGHTREETFSVRLTVHWTGFWGRCTAADGNARGPAIEITRK